MVVPPEKTPASFITPVIVTSKKIVYIFTRDITAHKKNSIQDVTELQKFLNEYNREALTITGYYDSFTQAAIRRFQKQYSHDTLHPWNINHPTGNTGIYTRQKINALMAEKN